jgi:type I restriction enzyme S subunit
VSVTQVQLGDVCREIYRYPTYYDIKYLEAGIPEVRAELIKEDGTLDVESQNWRFISPQTSSKFPRTVLVEGDLVLRFINDVRVMLPP